MHLFYTPDIQKPLYTLSEEESKHAIKVLRLQEADTIYLIDGKGGFYTAEITDTNPKRCTVKIIKEHQEYGRLFHLHIAIAPTKNIERIEWFLEKSTELGIDEITPIICQRSERKEIKLERLNKVITSAVKQSIKAYHPLLNEAVTLKKFLDTDRQGLKFIAHCMEGEKQFISELSKKQTNFTILIGPEGDFTQEEVDLAVKKGYQPISLGKNRLRTETAALAAVMEVNFLNR